MSIDDEFGDTVISAINPLIASYPQRLEFSLRTWYGSRSWCEYDATIVKTVNNTLEFFGDCFGDDTGVFHVEDLGTYSTKLMSSL